MLGLMGFKLGKELLISLLEYVLNLIYYGPYLQYMNISNFTQYWKEFPNLLLKAKLMNLYMM